MYARVLISRLQPGKSEEAVGVFRDSILPVARRQRGFKGALLIASVDGEKGIGITFWETEADLKATEASGVAQEQLAKLGQVIATPPATENYEVVFQV